jgi:hypothetical protein
MMPVLGLDDLDDPRYFAVAWKDRTVIATVPAVPGGILGDPSRWHDQIETRPEVDQAEQEKQRILFSNVVWLDDFRRQAWQADFKALADATVPRTD